MTQSTKILAKSINYGETTLLDHTIYVVQAIERFNLGFFSKQDVEIASSLSDFHN
jgi:hypothetical protein